MRLPARRVVPSGGCARRGRLDSFPVGTSLALVLVPNTLSPDRDQARSLLERAPDALDRVRNPPEGVAAIEANVRALLAPHRNDDTRGKYSASGWYTWWRGHARQPLGRGNEGWARDVCFADEVPERALDRVLAVFGPGADVVGLDVEDEARQRALRSALRENPECLAVAVTLKY